MSNTGFYFGGAFLDRSSLRNSILYYDKVIQYDMKSFFIEDYEKKEIFRRQVDKYYSSTKLYRDSGYLEFKNLQEWSPKYWSLRENLVRDFLFFNSNFNDFESEKISPRSMPVIIYRGYGKSNIFPSMRSFFDKPEEPNQFSNAASPVDQFSYLEFIPAVGREIVYGLLGSMEFDALPFTDNDFYALHFNQYLSYLAGELCYQNKWDLSKLAKELKDLGLDEGIIQNNPLFSNSKKEKERRTIEEILRIEVPFFSKIAEKDFLKFLDDEKVSLHHFRDQITVLVKKIRSTNYSEQFHNEIQDIVDTKINPSIEELKERFTAAELDIKKKRVKNVILTSATLCASIFLPLSVLILPPLLLFGGKTVISI